ncbi:MAG: HAMP domain-containing protein [Acidithiobacillus sp.]|nr:HAMP domain-containing protein [Acidithiobacillus sp.]
MLPFSKAWQHLTWRSKSMALVLLLIAMIYLLIAFFVYTSVREDLTSQVQTELQRLTQSISQAAANPLLLRNAGQLEALAKSSNSLVARIIITDSSGTVVASSELPLVGEQLNQKEQAALPRIYSYQASIRAGKDPLGTVWLQSNTKQINQLINNKLNHTISRLLLLGISTAIIGLVGAYLVSLAITRPVSRLMREMTQMEGQLGLASLTHGHPADASKDELYRLELAFRSMTQRLQEHLQELRKLHQRQQAMQCMVTIGQMSSQVAHEIRNALSSVRGAARYLVRYDDPANRDDFLRIIEEEVQRLYDMTQGFLDFGRSYEIHPSIQEVRPFLERCMQRHHADMEARAITVRLHCPADLKASFDASLLAQAMSNLLLNACDAAPERTGIIEISAFAENGGIKILVADNGPGIPPARRNEIFKPYVTTKTKGSGLGLAVVAKIMMIHEGTVELQDTDGPGACFALYLPSVFGTQIAPSSQSH